MGLQKLVAKNLQSSAAESGFKLGVVEGFQKGITLMGRISGSFHSCKNGLQKNVQNFCI